MAIKPVGASVGGLVVAGSPIPTPLSTPMGLSPSRLAKRHDKSKAIIKAATLLPPQSASRLISSVALATAHYSSAFGFDHQELDYTCSDTIASALGVSAIVTRLPRAWGGLGCVHSEDSQMEHVLKLGRDLLLLTGPAGRVARRFAVTRTGPFWRLFTHLLEMSGGRIATDGSIADFPNPAAFTAGRIASLVADASNTFPLRGRTKHTRAPLTALTICGTHPVLPLPPHAGTYAAQMATLTSPPLGYVCPLCHSPDSAGQAGHHRRCPQTRGERGNGHHAIVRTICTFANDTNGLSAQSKMDATTHTIPDITIQGLDPVGAAPFYIEVKTSERRGEEFLRWSNTIRAEATLKYRHLQAPLHVITLAHDGTVDERSWSVIKRLQGERTAGGLVRPRNRCEVGLAALLGHQMVLAEAAIQTRYDACASAQNTH